MELLEARGICKSFGARPILRDVSLVLRKGETVSLVGVSGAGKTTLFHVLSGLTRPERGQVLLSGQDITGTPGHISYMLQKDLLLPHKKVMDNVLLPLILRGVPRAQARAQAEPLFETFSLEGTQDLYPSQLSGGMRQRAALMRTYLNSSGVVMLDEPFSALDMITRGQMQSWYGKVRERLGLSTLLITHDIDEAILMSDRIYVLSGSPGEIRHELQVSQSRNQRLDFNLNPAFLIYKQQILDWLRP